MNRTSRIILITVIETFATVCVERGVYFYSEKLLGFSRATNLWLSLVFGLTYVCGALISHTIALRVKERRLLIASLGGQLVVHLVMGGWGGPVVVFVGTGLMGVLNGFKWPVIESYVSAGRTPAATARAVGLFNIAWGAGVPLALLAAGPIIRLFPRGLFLIPAALNAAAIAIALALPTSPPHLPHDHPERLPMGSLPRMRALLNTSRWLLLASYSSLWILAAIMPDIFAKLGFVVAAPALSALMDVVRLGAFVGLWFWTGWHGKVSPLSLSLVALPVGFFMILFGGNLAVVLGGELLYGAAMGVIYYAALYYAMVAKGATVGAAGGHESLIGAGFAIGPAAGLIGVAFVGVFGSEVSGMLVGVGPIFVVCSAGALLAIAKAVARPRGEPRDGGDRPGA